MNRVFCLNDPATTEIYTLSLHDALPICRADAGRGRPRPAAGGALALRREAGARRVRDERGDRAPARRRDRKSTRLNSSHANISYAVFCLKKKKYTYDFALWESLHATCPV